VYIIIYAIVNDDVYAAKIDCQFSVKQKVISQSITKLKTGTYVVISCFEADIILFTNRGYQCSTCIERHVVHWEASRRAEGIQVNTTLAYPSPERYTSPSAGDQPACHESSVVSYREPTPATVQQHSQFLNESMSTSATAVYPATSSPPQNVRQYRQHVTYLSSRAKSISRRSPAVAAATPTIGAPLR
jgi:hypothetical protein